jgi:hypothetical protein
METHYFDAPPDGAWSEVIFSMPFGAAGDDSGSSSSSRVVFGSVMVWLIMDWFGSVMV